LSVTNERVRVTPASIPFIDLAAQRRRLGGAVDAAIARVLGHCQFILGPEVRALEAELAQFCGTRHAVSCASGTDALVMVLMARGIGPGDAVICPTFTFAATAEVVALVGATPVFADVEEASFNLDPESVRDACAVAEKLGLNLKAVIPVDLFGQPADHDRIAAVAKSHGLFVLDDAAQAFAKKLGACWAGSSEDAPPEPLDCAIIYAPVGALVPTALRAVRKGGRVVCAGIHMSDIPSFPYDILWQEREIKSVANLTRQDGEEFFKIVPKARIATQTVSYPLVRANEALADLRSGRLQGAAVLVP